MLFSYKAVKQGGGEYEATMEAPDRFALYKEVHAKGDAVISVKEATKAGSLKKVLSLSWGGIHATDKIIFARNLSAMLKAGLPLIRALSVLEKQITSKPWKIVFSSIQDNLAKGVNFSTSLAAHPKVFSPLFTSMVAAGEESGNLSDSLMIIADELNKSHELTKKIRGALIYPAVILGLMIVIAVLMFIYVVPKLAATFRDVGAELPFITRMVMDISDGLQSHYVLIGGFFVLIIAGGILCMRTIFGRKMVDKMLLTLPIIGLILKELNSARVTRTLSSLLSSGLPLIAAIKITQGVVQNVHYKMMLEKTVGSIEKGSVLQPLFAAESKLYPPFVSEMIGVGEETGTLSKSLVEIAKFYEEEIDDKTKNMSSIIEPVLMIIVGLGVGIFALAMISPIYSLSSSI